MVLLERGNLVGKSYLNSKNSLLSPVYKQYRCVWTMVLSLSSFAIETKVLRRMVGVLGIIKMRLVEYANLIDQYIPYWAQQCPINLN